MALEISPLAFNCLQDSISISRDKGIRRLSTLISELRRVGWEEDHIYEAIRFWSLQEKEKLK